MFAFADVVMPTYDYPMWWENNTGALIFGWIVAVWTIICRWKIFKKAGLPGRWAIIPGYNIYLRFKAAGRSGRRVLSILFAPLYLIMLIIADFDMAKRFNRWIWFGFGLCLLSPIFYGILAFDDSKYTAKAIENK